MEYCGLGPVASLPFFPAYIQGGQNSWIVVERWARNCGNLGLNTKLIHNTTDTTPKSQNLGSTVAKWLGSLPLMLKVLSSRHLERGIAQKSFPLTQQGVGTRPSSDQGKAKAMKKRSGTPPHVHRCRYNCLFSNSHLLPWPLAQGQSLRYLCYTQATNHKRVTRYQ